MNSFLERIKKAALLKSDVYEEVEADEGAMFQAIGVVVLSSIAGGIGSVYQYGFSGMLMGAVAALISWFVWAYTVYFIGARILPEPQTEANPGQLLRTLGFASAPGLIRVAGIIQGLGNIIAIIASVWMLIAMVIAVRQALDYKSTLRAVVVCLIGWILYWLIAILIVAFFGMPGVE